MDEELAAQGFEIVTDENGQQLVKLMFMDENSESSGYALVSLEDGKKIMNGEATLQNVVDEEGEQVLTLVPIEQDGAPIVKTDVPTAHQDSQEPTQSFSDKPTEAASNLNPPQSESILENKAAEVMAESEKPQPSNDDDPKDVEMIEASAAEAVGENDNGEQFTISEETVLMDGQPTQMISLIDNAGNIIDQKHGQVGAQVIMEIHGQAFAYDVRGNSETGEPVTSTLILSTGDGTDDLSEAPPASPTAAVSHDATGSEQIQWSTGADGDAQQDEEIPPGQQFTLTEATALVNGKPIQTVLLTDDKGNVIDQKQGNTGEHVIIELNGQSLDYSFLGPSETGEPIQTILVVTQDDEPGEEESEATITASDWCPPGLPHDLYTTLCRHAEVLVSERLSNRPELSVENVVTEPYQRKLGPYPSYQEMVELAKIYVVGVSHGENLARYEILRSHAKIYRSGPQARPLTMHEMVVNEVASQLCRHKPGLLFHKRELFQLAQGIAEACSAQIKTAQLRAHQQSSVQASAQQSSQQPQPESTVVSGQVASSQLAMLESRGLTAIQPTSMPPNSAVVMSQVGVPTPGGTNFVPISSDSGMVIAYTSKDVMGDDGALISQSIRGKQPIGNSSMQHYLPNMPIVKRDLTYKLSASESEALRLAAVNTLTDMSASLEVKPKNDCTNIERASWERAMELVGLRSESAIGTTDSHAVANLLVNDATRVDSVREIAALYGRVPPQSNTANSQGTGVMGQFGGFTSGSQLSTQPRSAPVLTPYETACNEAAAYLAVGQPALLTRRRELVELARKVVRNSGCQFTHAPSIDRGYYSVDQVMELDLSLAEQLLHDPLERLNISDYSEDDGDDDMMLAMTCEEHNILDDVAVFSATGTDALKKVRILNLSGCSFTGIIPIHLNNCTNLVELNLSNNCLHAFPRCLHLPKLRNLDISKNPLLVRFAEEEGAPLVEQFPRLVTVELDTQLKDMLKPQSLAYLCPQLSSINGEEFKVEATEETIKAAQAAKQELASLVHSKWEDDLVEFFNKCVPHRDLVRVIETLVAHAVNQSLTVDEPFKHCKAVLARRITEEFLAPKVVDEDDDEDRPSTLPAADVPTSHGEVTDAAVEGGASSTLPGHGAAGVSTDEVKTKGKNAPAMSEEASGSHREELRRAEAEREAVAAAQNLALLPDEPLDRLAGIIGTAMQHGKTVVYSVIRTAARQPNGDLIIPVVGGSMAINGDKQDDDSAEVSDSENNAPIATTKHAAGPGRRRTVPSGGAVLGSRRPGIVAAATPRAKHRAATTVAARLAAQQMHRDQFEEDMEFGDEKEPVLGGTYGDLDEREETEMAEDVKPIVKTPGHWAPGKRGRPPLSHSMKKAQADKANQETAALLQKVKIPPPHAPPPATLRMSTRDSNRMKRFSAYGAIDTAAALAGQEDALVVAAMAQEDGEELGPVAETSTAKKTVEEDEDVSEEGETAEGTIVTVGDPAFIANAQEEENIIDEYGEELEEEPKPPTTKSRVLHPTPPKKAKKSTSGSAVAAKANASLAFASGQASEIVQTHAPKNFDDEVLVRELIDKSIKEDRVATVPSLMQLGDVVDYDPLHFIRCHARDNDPLDCSTKVWRCAFEPNPLDPRMTTSVVATCGGECVCLIDCQSGKVIKRFKHVGEEFYSVAWTTVEMATGHRTNLLSAAGKLKEIRLLHPEQLVCYAEMKGHREEIACMIFHPNKPTILFSGDSKAYIYVWDIGIPSAPEYRTKHQMLMRLMCPRAHLNPVLNIIFMPTYDTLVAGCEDGVFAWTIQDFKKQRSSEERMPTMELKIPTRREPCFDGLARLSENHIVVKCVEEGEIYVFDFSQLLLKRKRSSTSKRIVTAEVLGQLRWQITEEIYINVTARPGLGAVVCGDNEGTIWLYDLQAYVSSEDRAKKFKVKPVKILEWPECSVGGNREEDPQVKESINSGFKNPIVNASDISSDGVFLVAVTDNNLVCIWNFSG